MVERGVLLATIGRIQRRHSSMGGSLALIWKS
jgi:hypothetical protein